MRTATGGAQTFVISSLYLKKLELMFLNIIHDCITTVHFSAFLFLSLFLFLKGKRILFFYLFFIYAFDNILLLYFVEINLK